MCLPPNIITECSNSKQFADLLLSPAPDMGINTQSSPLSASPVFQGNPLIVDPFLETTPPPGAPHDRLGIGTAPDYNGPLQPGQTLIIYHQFAQHPPEIIDTANLMSMREPDFYPPSEEPYAPFKTRTDFEQAEIFIRHNCTNTMINDQLRLNQKVYSAGEPGVQTMKNAREMHNILARAGQYQDISSVSSHIP